MNVLRILIAFLFIGLYACQNKNIETKIFGKITGDISKGIYYTLPIDGVCNFVFKDSVQHDSLGNFEIDLEIDVPSFVRVILWGKASRTLLVEKGKTYQLDINAAESDDKVFSVLGDNAEIQDGIQLFDNPDNIQRSARSISRNSTVAKIKDKLAVLKQTELDPFMELLSDHKISKEFYELVKIDRDCYYAAIQGTIALLKKYEDLRKENGVFTNEVNSLWDEAFVEFSPSDISLMRSPWYYSFANNYVEYTIYTDSTFNQENVLAIFEEGLRHSFHLKKSKEHFTLDVLEYHNASYLFNAAFQTRYEKELIELFAAFNVEFPHSSYRRFIKPLIDPIVEFHKAKEDPFSAEVEFIETSEQKVIGAAKEYNSLNDVLESLKGRKLYIDVWATWCAPCKEEFAHKDKLYDLLGQYDFDILYISIDEKDKEEQWRNMIKFYDLKGQHIRANERLDTELVKLFPLHDGIAIPWYLIVDENGEIKIDFASKPSELNSLEMELKMI